MNVKNVMSEREASSDFEIDVSKIASVIWRGKYIVISSVVAFLVIAFAYVNFIAVPTYRASSVVVMESREAQVMGMSVESILGGLSNDSTVVTTEVQVLQGRELIGRVVDRLNLMEDPEFNGTLRPKGMLARLRGFLSSAPAAAPDPDRVRDSVVSAVLRAMTVENIPDSLAFQITLETESAGKSALIADTIARLYIDDQILVKFEATKRAAEWLAEQVSDLKAELEKSENEIRRFQSDMSIASADELTALDRQLKDTRDRHAASEAQAKAIEARQTAIAQAVGRSGQAAALADPQLIELAVAAERGDAAAVSAFERRRDLLGQQMAQDLLRLRGQANSYAIAERNLVDTITQASQELARFDQMSREAESSKLLYEHFQTRLKEAVAQQGIQQPDSRVLSRAVQPSAPASPRRGLLYALAIVLGGMIGTALVLLRETLAKGVRTANDLERMTGRMVLGQIPLVPDRDRSKILPFLAKNPTSAMAEAVRNLRTSILLSDIDKSPRVIAVTSSVPGEGKTTLSLALGQNLTTMGKKVLIIEGDIRRRSFKRHLNIPGEGGLVSVLSGERSLSETAHFAPGLGHILLGEKTATNAADLFSSEAFTRLIAEARKIYDIIIIDTPPVLVVPDARVIAQHADAVVFIVRWDRTSAEQVRDSLHMLDMTNVKIAGLVLSQIDPKGMRRYGYGERYGAYAAYGKQYYTTS